jgi:hypothetical protein
MDLDMIQTNAKIYNGEDHPLYADAKKLVEGIKRQIRGFQNVVEDDSKRSKQRLPEEATKIVINTSSMRPTSKNFSNIRPGKASV